MAYSSLFKRDVRITQAYKGVNHKGLDMSTGAVRTPVYLPNKAVEGYVWEILKGYSYNGKYYANSPIIYIRHKDGSGSRYIHSYPEDVKVKVGDTIKAGIQVCCTGNSGYSKGDHLHFEWLKTWNDMNSHTDPAPFVMDDNIKLLGVGERLEFLKVMNIRNDKYEDIGDVAIGAVGEIVGIADYKDGYQYYKVRFDDITGLVADTNYNIISDKQVTKLNGDKAVSNEDLIKQLNELNEKIIKLENLVNELSLELDNKDSKIDKLQKTIDTLNIELDVANEKIKPLKEYGISELVSELLGRFFRSKEE